MKTVEVYMTENEFDKYKLENTEFTLSEWIDIIGRELAQNRLEKSIELAEKYGLSKMTLEEISSEVKTDRTSAKNNN